jgi:hypothetical protein
MTLSEGQALIEKAKESTDAARSLAKDGHRGMVESARKGRAGGTGGGERWMPGSP